jgi:hypothetical protein
MTLYEVLTLLVALIGAVTGIASLIRTRKVEKKHLEFQAIAASLAKRQLEALDRQEGVRTKADVVVELVKVGRNDFRFVLSNQGAAPATNIDFQIAKGSPDDPLVRNECQQKLPYQKLDPGQSFTLIAARHMGSAMTYATHITWQNIDGSSDARDAHVSV